MLLCVLVHAEGSAEGSNLRTQVFVGILCVVLLQRLLKVGSPQAPIAAIGQYVFKFVARKPIPNEVDQEIQRTFAVSLGLNANAEKRFGQLVECFSPQSINSYVSIR
jgi:hypothetical protein